MLVHGIAEIDEGIVDLAEPQKTLLRELDLERGVDGEGDGYGQGANIDPVSSADGHAVAGEKGAAKAEGEEKKEDDGWRMHVECILADGHGICHVVDGRQEESAGVRRGCGGDRLPPYLTLQSLALRRGLFDDSVIQMET